MNEHGPILVPLDGSELAEGALQMASEMARAERTHLVLLSVWEPPGSALSPTMNSVWEPPTFAAAPNMSIEMERRARDYFQTYLEGVRTRVQHKEIRNVVRSGDPADEILATAESLGARMIVVASHGRSGVGRWLYGSTANRLLHESQVPVLVVGPKALDRPSRSQVKHVMVPLDGSPLSEAAIEPGVSLATAFGARLSLVQAVRWAYETYPYMGAAGYIQSLDSDLEAGASGYIEKRVSSIKGKVDARGFVVRGVAADALISFEESEGVDLVVMTTHARSGVARAVLGSTAERMLQGRAPVLLLRPEPEAAAAGSGIETSRKAAATRN